MDDKLLRRHASFEIRSPYDDLTLPATDRAFTSASTTEQTFHYCCVAVLCGKHQCHRLSHATHTITPSIIHNMMPPRVKTKLEAQLFLPRCLNFAKCPIIDSHERATSSVNNCSRLKTPMIQRGRPKAPRTAAMACTRMKGPPARSGLVPVVLPLKHDLTNWPGQRSVGGRRP